ncbi:MAG: glutamyl-tRNA reductase [Chlamydiales bacterium]|nr:glutamyl-tRNA reductase [Chlamydiales bacterium]
MLIGILGINHKSASLSLREKLAKACVKRFHPSHLHSLDFVPLSTCNRTEIYFSAFDLAQMQTYLLNILREEIEEEFEHCVYSYFGMDAFLHLARVTSGMDSAIVGETEIQGQVKQAYELACSKYLPHTLHFIFQKSLKIGKEVRSKSLLDRGLPTLEDTIFTKVGAKKKVLFVGISKINQKIFNRFVQKGVTDITFCNRTEGKSLGTKSLPFRSLHLWQTYDVAIFGTRSPDFLITPQTILGTRPRLVIDLCVPRNVDPRLSRQPQVTLYNIDQLNREIDRKRKLKAAALEKIEHEIIERGVERQFALFAARSSATHNLSTA